MSRSDDGKLEIEGPMSKLYRVYEGSGEGDRWNGDMVGEYDSRREALGHRRRLDKSYKVRVRSKWVTWQEFVEQG